MVHETQMSNHPVIPNVGPSSTGVGPAPAASFDEVLSRQNVSVGNVKFSAHASQRLAQRKIELSENDLTRIAEAADRAATKGSRESLFLLDHLGLIVNVRNRTVLTAIDPERMRGGIVTNIDSTVIIGRD